MTIIAKVEPISKDRVMIRLAPGYTFVSFKLADGGIEIVVLDRHATETTRLGVAAPPKGRKLTISPDDPGTAIEIIYSDE